MILLCDKFNKIDELIYSVCKNKDYDIIFIIESDVLIIENIHIGFIEYYKKIKKKKKLFKV